jgi:hypothetical protein
MNLFEGGGVPLASASVPLRGTGALSAAGPPMPFSLFRSTGRAPRCLPLPPLFMGKRLLLGKSMVTSDTEAGRWFVVDILLTYSLEQGNLSKAILYF